MVLVIIFLLLVMFIGSVGVVSRELKVTSDATQKERSYRIAEAGIQYVLFLLIKGGFTPSTLTTLTTDQKNNDVTDSLTDQPIGSYALTFSPLPSPANGLYVVSTGTSDTNFCSRSEARIENTSGVAGEYVAHRWVRSACP